MAPRGTAVTQLPPLCMRDGITRNIRLHVELSAGCHLTEGATSRWKIVIPEGNVWKCVKSIGSVVRTYLIVCVCVCVCVCVHVCGTLIGDCIGWRAHLENGNIWDLLVMSFSIGWAQVQFS